MFTDINRKLSPSHLHCQLTPLQVGHTCSAPSQQLAAAVHRGVCAGGRDDTRGSEVGLNVRKYIFIVFVFSLILQNNNKTTRAKWRRTTSREKKRAVGCDLQRSRSRLTVWGTTFSSALLFCYAAQSDAVSSDSLHSRQSTVGGDKPTCDELLQPQKQRLSGDGGTFRDCSEQQPEPDCKISLIRPNQHTFTHIYCDVFLFKA